MCLKFPFLMNTVFFSSTSIIITNQLIYLTKLSRLTGPFEIPILGYSSQFFNASFLARVPGGWIFCLFLGRRRERGHSSWWDKKRKCRENECTFQFWSIKHWSATRSNKKNCGRYKIKKGICWTYMRKHGSYLNSKLEPAFRKPWDCMHTLTTNTCNFPCCSEYSDPSLYARQATACDIAAALSIRGHWPMYGLSHTENKFHWL